ncbi:MAG: hypothetical protein ACM3JB_00800 [Acidobacteriaceae bacterium]
MVRTDASSGREDQQQETVILGFSSQDPPESSGESAELGSKDHEAKSHDVYIT